MKTTINRRQALLSLGSTAAALCMMQYANTAKIPPDVKSRLLKRYHGDAIKIDYINKGYLTTDEMVMKIHQFFSPNCILPGLSKSQLDLCLQLHRIRELQKMEHEKVLIRTRKIQLLNRDFVDMEIPPFPQSLPTELQGGKPISNERFNMGIKKMLCS